MPILPSPGDFTSFDIEAEHHEGEVTDVPRNFKKWVGKNDGRIAKAKKLPNFLKDNKGYWKGKEKNIATKSLLRASLSEEIRRRRSEIKREARILLQKVIIHDSLKGKQIAISKTGIKEWLNQPHADYATKNELLLHINKELPNMHYLGYGKDKHNDSIKMHLFETKIGDTPSWIIVREFSDGKILIHSVTDSKTILQYLEKKKSL